MGHLAISGTFLTATSGLSSGMLLNTLQCTEQYLTAKNDLVQYVSSAEVQKLCHRFTVVNRSYLKSNLSSYVFYEGR